MVLRGLEPPTFSPAVPPLILSNLGACLLFLNQAKHSPSQSICVIVLLAWNILLEHSQMYTCLTLLLHSVPVLCHLFGFGFTCVSDARTMAGMWHALTTSLEGMRKHWPASLADLEGDCGVQGWWLRRWMSGQAALACPSLFGRLQNKWDYAYYVGLLWRVSQMLFIRDLALCQVNMLEAFLLLTLTHCSFQLWRLVIWGKGSV